jgi:hypothetical protein
LEVNTMAAKAPAVDVIATEVAVIRVIREELVANDTTVEIDWAPGVALPLDVTLDAASALRASPAPVNDNGFVAELALERCTQEDAEAMCAADEEFRQVCDERRDAWIARLESEMDACDQ